MDNAPVRFRGELGRYTLVTEKAFEEYNAWAVLNNFRAGDVIRLALSTLRLCKEFRVATKADIILAQLRGRLFQRDTP